MRISFFNLDALSCQESLSVTCQSFEPTVHVKCRARSRGSWCGFRCPSPSSQNNAGVVGPDENVGGKRVRGHWGPMSGPQTVLDEIPVLPFFSPTPSPLPPFFLPPTHHPELLCLLPSGPLGPQFRTKAPGPQWRGPPRPRCQVPELPRAYAQGPSAGLAPTPLTQPRLTFQHKNAWLWGLP